jgi:hypothetical protein
VLVKWGKATTDEMCIGFIGLTKKRQNLTKPSDKDEFVDILRQQQQEMREKYKKHFALPPQARESKSCRRRREIEAERAPPNMFG